MENEPTPAEEPRFTEIDSREVHLLGRQLIRLYYENDTYEAYVLVNNTDVYDDHFVVKVPEEWNPNIVYMNPWDFRV